MPPEGIPAHSPVRLMLVDDHEMVRIGLKAMLAPFTGQVRVVGEASDVATARRVVAGLDPDLVLADVRLGGESGLDLCRDLVQDSPGRKVILPRAVLGITSSGTAEPGVMRQEESFDDIHAAPSNG